MTYFQTILFLYFSKLHCLILRPASLRSRITFLIHSLSFSLPLSLSFSNFLTLIHALAKRLEFCTPEYVSFRFLSVSSWLELVMTAAQLHHSSDRMPGSDLDANFFEECLDFRSKLIFCYKCQGDGNFEDLQTGQKSFENFYSRKGHLVLRNIVVAL